MRAHTDEPLCTPGNIRRTVRSPVSRNGLVSLFPDFLVGLYFQRGPRSGLPLAGKRGAAIFNCPTGECFKRHRSVASVSISVVFPFHRRCLLPLVNQNLHSYRGLNSLRPFVIFINFLVSMEQISLSVYLSRFVKYRKGSHRFTLKLFVHFVQFITVQSNSTKE